jgi:hypothetical protein
MAASYQTGMSTSPTNLLQTLVTWLVAQGWTSDMSQADSTGWRAHLHSAGLYVNLRAAANEKIWPNAGGGNWDLDAGYGIGLYLGDGFSSGSAWHAQSGRPLRTDGSPSGCGANLPSGSVSAYHLFDDGAGNICLVVERSPGIFCHLGWGPALAAMGNPEAFPYFFGSSNAYRNTQDSDPGGDRFGQSVTAMPPMSIGNKESRAECCAFVHVDAATFSSRWVGNCGPASGAAEGYTGRAMGCALNANPNAAGNAFEDQFPGYQFILSRVHQVAFSGALLLPLHCFVLTDPAARWAPVGYPPAIFWCEAVGHGFNIGQIVAIGGIDYMLFPHFAIRKDA